MRDPPLQARQTQLKDLESPHTPNNLSADSTDFSFQLCMRNLAFVKLCGFSMNKLLSFLNLAF
jgi:hypothetical protein